jgi:hypothetical protein
MLRGGFKKSDGPSPADLQEVSAEFVKTELQTGITFADLALSAKHKDRRERNTANARKAYDTALRFMDTVSPTPEIDADLNDRLQHLRAQLEKLGETI